MRVVLLLFLVRRGKHLVHPIFVYHRTCVGANRIRPQMSENETNTQTNIPKISIEQL